MRANKLVSIPNLCRFKLRQQNMRVGQANVEVPGGNGNAGIGYGLEAQTVGALGAYGAGGVFGDIDQELTEFNLSPALIPAVMWWPYRLVTA